MFEFTQTRLRGANDVFKKGGHVTKTMRDQVFRMFYDNRRMIKEPNNNTDSDMSNKLFDSTPLHNNMECLHQRFLSRLPFSLPFHKNTSKTKSPKYKSFLDVAVRNFIKGYLSKQPCFGLKGDEFKSYKDLMKFIYGNVSAKDIKLTKQSISNLKHRKIIFRPVLKTKETMEFTKYLKDNIPYFKEELFLKIY